MASTSATASVLDNGMQAMPYVDAQGNPALFGMVPEGRRPARTHACCDPSCARCLATAGLGAKGQQGGSGCGGGKSSRKKTKASSTCGSPAKATPCCDDCASDGDKTHVCTDLTCPNCLATAQQLQGDWPVNTTGSGADHCCADPTCARCAATAQELPGDWNYNSEKPRRHVCLDPDCARCKATAAPPVETRGQGYNGPGGKHGCVDPNCARCSATAQQLQGDWSSNSEKKRPHVCLEPDCTRCKATARNLAPAMEFSNPGPRTHACMEPDCERCLATAQPPTDVWTFENKLPTRHGCVDPSCAECSATARNLGEGWNWDSSRPKMHVCGDYDCETCKATARPPPATNWDSSKPKMHVCGDYDCETCKATALSALSTVTHHPSLAAQADCDGAPGSRQPAAALPLSRSVLSASRARPSGSVVGSEASITDTNTIELWANASFEPDSDMSLVGKLSKKFDKLQGQYAWNKYGVDSFSTPKSLATGSVEMPSPPPMADESRRGIWINIHAGASQEAYLAAGAGAGTQDAFDPATDFPKLMDIVMAAEWFGQHKLTILFTGQWTDYILTDSGALADLAAIIGWGHRIGFHHHDTSHVYWDGYHNLPDGQCAARHPYLECYSITVAGHTFYQHPVSEAFRSFLALTEALHADYGVPLDVFEEGFVANHGSEPSYRDYEWQSEAVYSQGSERNDASDYPGLVEIDALSSVCIQELGGEQASVPYLVPEIGSGHLQVGSEKLRDVTLDKIIEELDAAGIGDYVGITIHPWEYRQTGGDSEKVAGTWGSWNDDARVKNTFATLSRMGHRAQLIQDVLATEVAAGAPLC